MSKEIIQIASRLVVKTFLHDNLNLDHHDSGWEDGRLYLMLDPDNEAVLAHDVNRIVVETRTILEALNDVRGFSQQKMRPMNRGKTIPEVTVIVNTDTCKVRIALTLKGMGRDSKLPEGRALYVASLSEIMLFLDVQESCLPMAGRAYWLQRGAVVSGDEKKADVIQRGLANRLTQLEALSRCKSPTLRDALVELIAINDVFFESALEGGDPNQAIELIRQHVEGNVSLNDELAEKVRQERERLAADKARKERSIATFADIMAERERVMAEREVQKAKRNKRSAVNVRTTAADDAKKLVAALGLDQDGEEPIENDEAPADSAETESDEIDADKTEGSPEVETAVKEAPRLNARAKRMYAERDARMEAAPAPEAPKPTVPEAKKVEADAKPLTFAEKLAARKASMPIAADSAPAADGDKTE